MSEPDKNLLSAVLNADVNWFERCSKRYSYNAFLNIY